MTKSTNKKSLPMVVSGRTDFLSTAFWCYVLSVVLLPIGLGGDRAFPFGFAQVGFAVSALCLVCDGDYWKQLYVSTRVRVALCMLAAVLVWAFIQTQSFVPESWSHPLWQSAASTLNRHVHGGISVVPEDSLRGLTRLITYIVAGVLAYLLTQDARRARQLVRAIWLAGIAICLYGFAVLMTGNHLVLWYRKWAYFDDITATFVNRNHFAIYAGMVFACGMALFIQSWRENVQRRKPHQKIAALREWLVGQGAPQIFFLSLVFVAIVLSNSRAGLVFSMIGFGSYLLFHQVYIRAWWRAIAVGLLTPLAVVVVALVAASFSDRFEHLFNDYSSMTRTGVYEISWRAIMDNPWLGYGLNGFEPEFRLYQQNFIDEFNHAHSDILESLLDLGMPAGLLLWAAIALLLSGLWRGIVHRRRNGMFPALALAASVMALGHALVDFDLQIPGVAITWAALLGTGLAQSWGREQEMKSSSAAGS